MDIFKYFRKKRKPISGEIISICLNGEFMKVEYEKGSRTINMDFLGDKDVCMLSRYFKGRYITINIERQMPQNEIIKTERRFIVNKIKN